MLDKPQGGALANRSGKWLEDNIYSNLTYAGYEEISDADKKLLIRQDGVLNTPVDKWFCTQLRLERNLYDAKYTSDFYIFCAEKWPNGLHIEAKWQNSSGSVDEKYVFTALSLLSFPAPALLILAGGGARQGAVQWLKQKGKRRGFTFLTGFDEFILWAQKEL